MYATEGLLSSIAQTCTRPGLLKSNAMLMRGLYSAISTPLLCFSFRICLLRGIDCWFIFNLVTIVVSLHINNSFANFGKGISTPSSNSFPDCLAVLVSNYLMPSRTLSLTHKNVRTPTVTSHQLTDSRRSRPVRALPFLPPPPPRIPVFRRLYHCHGDMANMTLTKPNRPKDAKPLSMCSIHVGSSSSKPGIPKSSLVENGLDVRVPTGSTYRLMIGSATNPRKKIVAKRIKIVSITWARVLVTQLPHLILSSLYRNLHVGHSQKFRRPYAGSACLHDWRQPSCTYFCEPLHLHGRMRRPDPGSWEIYVTCGAGLSIPVNPPVGVS